MKPRITMQQKKALEARLRKMLAEELCRAGKITPHQMDRIR